MIYLSANKVFLNIYIRFGISPVGIQQTTNIQQNTQAMLFRTEFTIPESDVKINVGDRILLAGSCFAENIASKMASLHWKVMSNPHGILFNPASLRTCFSDISSNRHYNQAELFSHDGLYHSFSHHGSFSDTDAGAACRNINDSIAQAHSFLKQADWIILTLGTAWTWRINESGAIAANCHKVPQKNFTKELLTLDEIILNLEQILHAIGNINAGAKILLTVSPVRYLKDGFVENARSKALLITAIHHIAECNVHCRYFPAYELFMDDLRDYRFTKEDMTHPNALAVEYIWQKFVQAYFSTDAKSFNAELQRLADLKNHRPLNTGTSQYATFLNRIRQTEQELLQKYPFIKFPERQ